MATLHTTRQSSAFTARTRLKQVCRERVEARPASTDPDPAGEAPPLNTPPQPAPSRMNAYSDRLSELDQRQLLLQTAAIYHGWHLVSVQNRHESGVLVAYLVRNNDEDEPSNAIREGRALQIIMDAVGDLKVQHPRRRKGYLRLRWMNRLLSVFAS